MDEKRTAMLQEYYNKFCEENRFNSRHGQIEYRISLKYIRKYLSMLGKKPSDIKLIDIGAGTGRYSIPLAEEGIDVTAIDLSPNNVGILKKKSDKVKAYRGNALDLKKFKSGEYDACILFGPMYHLSSFEDKKKALLEAKRLVKSGGYIFVAYVMNEYAFLSYAIMEGHLEMAVADGSLDESFHVTDRDENLYSFVRLEDVDRINAECGLTRELVISPDGPANHMRLYVNRLTPEGFELFVKYQESVCERPDLLGASAHIVDILRSLPDCQK